MKERRGKWEIIGIRKRRRNDNNMTERKNKRGNKRNTNRKREYVIVI